MYNGNGFNNNSNSNNNYDELNYPDLISASIQTCNAFQLLLYNNNNNRNRSEELKVPPMPPPLSNAILQRIENELKSNETKEGAARSGTANSTAADIKIQSRGYTFEVEKEILARDAERRWKESTSSSSHLPSVLQQHSSGHDTKMGNDGAKTGPVDAPADHHETEDVEVDSTGCPINMLSNASSSCGEFLRWKK